ncbi:DUF3784 domain-containing protein [Cytobacillus dafuensis]|uniref:DUF3784 domain-containing protein n=1 Tax=Cytobacillus dafuensis TaxID=1742359 RepID=A0A5B8Z5N5_CYTDA|nr:DUF3784 domain-containing protein [Cytobacillus dafuensis]QED46696.1 DUF3784 domain-containing protein [Cytobacillus dafuensis]
MIGLIATIIIMILIFGLLGWAIRYKKAYFLISGFESRSEEEKQELIENGLPQKTGGLLLLTAAVMLLLLPLLCTPFKYAIEFQFGGMLVFLMGGVIYLSKYEVPRKRKRSYMISISLFIAVVGSITALTLYSYQGYQLIVKEEQFEITGMYGDEWRIKDIKKVELMETMPQVKAKTNGVGLPTLSKGHFKVKDYGSSLLFIQKEASPYIYIELEDRKIFINDKNSNKTREWFQQLKEKAENTK